MDFSDVIRTRKSVRGYSNKEVEEEKLMAVLEAARVSPSWANKQCVNYIVIKDKSRISELGGFFNGWLKQAPIVVVACADPKESGSHDNMDYYLVDIGISMQQLILAATDQGLGTCWIGAFDEKKVKKALRVPNNVKVVALTPLGYPAEEGVRVKIVGKFIGSSQRQQLDQIVHKDNW